MLNNLSELLANISNGNESAFQELYYRYYDRLYAFARVYVRSAAQAEDVVSDVFFNLWNGRHTLPAIAFFETYLYKAVKNGCLNALKSSYHRRVSLTSEQVDLEVYIEDARPDTTAMYNELSNALEAAIASLPDRCKLIFKMVKEDGLRYKQVAEILDISPRTVETQVAIAIKKIEQTLAPHLQQP